MPSMIVLCPTRELAKQVGSELQDVCKPLGLFSTVFHGGVSYDPQSRALRQGVDVVVGTPGRIMDHLDRGNLNLAECNVVVLDEADEMLNMGFAEDVEVILEGAGDEIIKRMMDSYEKAANDSLEAQTNVINSSQNVVSEITKASTDATIEITNAVSSIVDKQEKVAGELLHIF